MLRVWILCVMLVFSIAAQAGYQYLLDAPAGEYRRSDFGEPGEHIKYGLRIKMEGYALGTKWPPGAYTGFYDGVDMNNSVQFLILKHPDKDLMVAAYRVLKDGEEVRYQKLESVPADEEVFVKIGKAGNKIYIFMDDARPITIKTDLQKVTPYISVSSGKALFSEEDVTDWKLEDIPDVDAMYQEAITALQEGRHQEALDIHLWYHHNALIYAPSHYGVRLSYMLHNWYELAKRFPPAMQALKETRDTAGDQVRQGKDYYRAFNDYDSINSVLGEDDKTVALFVWLDGNYPLRAKRAYRLAKPALVKAKEYALLGKYLNPDKEYMQYVQYYDQMLEFAEKHDSAESLDYAHDNFAHQIATLVSLLVLNERHKEAEEIAEVAILELDTPTFSQMLDNALNGIPPAPYP